jgi:predicted amidohydrolase
MGTFLNTHAVALAEVTVSGPNGVRVEHCQARIRERGTWRRIEGAEDLFVPPQMSGGRYIDPASRAAVAAARALKDRIPPVPAERLGCLLATRTGNAYSVALYETARLSGKRAGPLLFAHAGWNVPVALVAAELGCRGITATLCAGTSSIEVLRYARIILARRRAEALLVGAVDLKPVRQTDAADPQVEANCVLCLLGLNKDDSDHAVILDDAWPWIPECH